MYIKPTSRKRHYNVFIFLKNNKGKIQNPTKIVKNHLGLYIAQWLCPLKIVIQKSNIECGSSKNSPGLSRKYQLRITLEESQRRAWINTCEMMVKFFLYQLNDPILKLGMIRKKPAREIKHEDSLLSRAKINKG